MAALPGAFRSESIAMIRQLFADQGRRHVGAYLLAGLLMAASAAATGLSAYLLKPVLDHMVETNGFRALELLSLAIAGLFLVRGLATYCYTVLLARTGNRIVAQVQANLFDHLLNQNMAFFQDRHSSEFTTRVGVAAAGIRDTLQVIIMSAGRDVLTLAGLVIVMFIQDARMSVIALALMPIGAYGLSRLIKSVRALARSSFDGTAQVLEIMQETIQGLRIVKSFNLERVMQRRMRTAVGNVERAANRMAASMAIASPLADFCGGLAIAVVIFYGGWRVAIAHADAGSFFSFLAALLMAYEPAKRLARFHLEIQNGLVGAKLVYEIIDQPAPEAADVARPPLAMSRGRISFEKVSFAYRNKELVLDGLDFIGEPEKTTALVGPSGGGKSTILALIQRFYDPCRGRIAIDGVDVRRVDIASLRRKIAFVSQDVFLFHASIAANIGLGRPGASQADIVAAARQANAHDFIMSFAAGYATPVGEHGLHLSAGQRQRIAIARAILKQAPILLLDEPTAALDPESEQAIQVALEDLRRGRTTIVVAHRLQTIVAADRITMIEAGRAVEAGTHAELIAGGGKYMRFFQSQFELAEGPPAVVI
ncbi:MAG TPA: ABC transporter ATP-binding protein [Methylovirgula sp.]|nr:ABC transporter ATP-binding protein [Methylovirgula sp.]